MKKSKKIALYLFNILPIFAATNVFAVSSNPVGWFLDADAGISRVFGESYPGVPQTSSGGSGWSVAGGYKFMPYIAGEVGYSRYADTRLQDSTGVTAARDVRYMVDAAARGILPVTDTGFEFFAKAGLAWINSSIQSIDPTSSIYTTVNAMKGTQTSRSLYWGGGISYFFNSTVSAHVQYAQAQGSSNTGSVGLTSLGISLLI